MTPGPVGAMQVNLTIPSMVADTYPIVLTQGAVGEQRADDHGDAVAA
jgi:hypothetical protein